MWHISHATNIYICPKCHHVNNNSWQFNHAITDNRGMSIWDRIREEIAAQNTTQEWVATKVGVRADLFRRWMSRQTMPNADQVARMAEALGTTVEYLVTGRHPLFLGPADEAFLETARKWRPVLDDLEDLEPPVALSWVAGIHGAAEAARASKPAKNAFPPPTAEDLAAAERGRNLFVKLGQSDDEKRKKKTS